MTQSILILNGPGLDRLGEIDPDRYGSASLADIESACRDAASELGYEIDFRQSNDTGEVLRWVVDAAASNSGIVINPAIATQSQPELHQAYDAIMQALNHVQLPTIEVHLSNVFVRGEREVPYYVSTVSLGMICGFGVEGYKMAITGLVEHLQGRQDRVAAGVSV